MGDLNHDAPASDMATAYNSGLLEIIDRLAPLCTKTVTLRPHAPWYTDELRDEKRRRRSAERLWLSSRLEVHRQMYRSQCVAYNRMLIATKETYYSGKIANCGSDAKQLLNITKHLMGNEKIAKMPVHTCSSLMAQQFSDFFVTKVNTIQQELKHGTHDATKVVMDPMSDDVEFGMVWYGMVWYGMVWYGMVWYGMVWYGMVWYGMVWYGMVWYGMVWYGMVWYGMVWYGMVWYGMVWYGMVWYGMVWYGMVWYGMVWYGMVWYGMVWYGMVWYGMVWYGMVWYGMVWYGMVWYGMVWYGMVWYGMVWYGMVWYGMVWYGMVWYGMVWYGMVWYGMVWYGMVWYGVYSFNISVHRT